MSSNINRYPYQAANGNCHKEFMTCKNNLELQAIIEKYSLQEAVAAIWLPNRLLWGRISQDQISLQDGSSFADLTMVEFRLFNENMEIYGRNNGTGYSLRVIQDSPAGEATVEYVDIKARLWGENQGSQAGYVHLVDIQRGIVMDIPADDNQHKYYGLLTRNYIGYLANSQASYTDSRYVAIVNGEEE